jgi:hypothetical protein
MWLPQMHAFGFTCVVQPTSMVGSVAKLVIVVVLLLLSASCIAIPRPPVYRSTKFGTFPAAIFNPSGLPWILSPSRNWAGGISERSMESAEQPADAQRNKSGRIRLRLDGFAQQRIERLRRLPRFIGALAIQILSCPASLIENALCLGLCVSGYTAEPLLHFSSEIASRALDPIVIHDTLQVVV